MNVITVIPGRSHNSLLLNIFYNLQQHNFFHLSYLLFLLHKIFAKLRLPLFQATQLFGETV